LGINAVIRTAELVLNVSLNQYHSNNFIGNPDGFIMVEKSLGDDGMEGMIDYDA
jgi:hypothetical protein